LNTFAIFLIQINRKKNASLQKVQKAIEASIDKEVKDLVTAWPALYDKYQQKIFTDEVTKREHLLGLG
jgi:hypothetical protein